MVFIELNNLVLHLDGKTEKDTFEPSTITCPTATRHSLSPSQPPGEEESHQPLGHVLDSLETRKGILQQLPDRPHTHRHTRLPEFCQDVQCLFLPFRRTHSPLHQEVSHQFQEATRSWTQSGHNPETTSHWRNLHLPAVPLVGWLHHHLQIGPPGLLSHPC